MLPCDVFSPCLALFVRLLPVKTYTTNNLHIQCNLTTKRTATLQGLWIYLGSICIYKPHMFMSFHAISCLYFWEGMFVQTLAGWVSLRLSPAYSGIWRKISPVMYGEWHNAMICGWGPWLYPINDACSSEFPDSWLLISAGPCIRDAHPGHLMSPMKYPILLLLAWLKPLIHDGREYLCVQKYLFHLEQGPFLNIFPKLPFGVTSRNVCRLILTKLRFFPRASTWIKLLRFQKGEPFLVQRRVSCV